MPAAAAMSADQAPEALAAGLARRLGGAVGDLKRLSGGASQQTWAFTLDGLPLILRRAPPGAASRSGLSAGLATEAGLLALAGRHGLPVPQVHTVLAESDGLGDGYVMQRLEGQTLGRRIATDPALAAAREHLAFDCGRALARLHAIPDGQITPALRRASPADELAHHRDWHARHGTARPVFQLALRWLEHHCPPPPAREVLVHGDFRNGNLMVGPDGLRGVLDWELAHRGDAMEDLGWMLVASWRFGEVALEAGGFGTRAQLLAGYEAAGGQVDAARVHWWQVMGTLKWGVICESMLASWLAGAEPEIEKAAIGRRASETELDLLDLLCPRTAHA